MKLACVYSGTAKSLEHYQKLSQQHKWVPAEIADVIIVLGGDGFLLQSIHDFGHLPAPIYGMNSGTVGFLLNQFQQDDLLQRLALAHTETISPIITKLTTVDGLIQEVKAFNEVALIRQGGQTASISVTINGKERMPRLDGDGILIATPVGSTAYNLSAGGPIVPVGANLLSLAPLNPFRPRSWSGALLPDSVEIEISTLQQEKRPVSVACDGNEVRNVIKAQCRLSNDIKVSLLFDPGHSLEDRIIREQFET
ncbi:NAD kinase [Paraferrimonas sp. SM1919]|uniref:NAD kinase n=1 Tax=Paraferrimonas sp. SM1919 TaxID=2662263 RepID=UPI0013D1DFAC|nr:NAD kinase [Paraferrimonas sp. SM1919]